MIIINLGALTGLRNSGLTRIFQRFILLNSFILIQLWVFKIWRENYTIIINLDHRIV